MTKRMLLVLLALSLVLGAMFGWKFYQAQKMAVLANMPPTPATVAAADVQTESWQPYLEAVGSLVATHGILVTTEVAGIVSAIHFESGQPVEAGTLLLQLDDSVDQAELSGITAEQRLAELQFKRREGLLESKTISPFHLPMSTRPGCGWKTPPHVWQPSRPSSLKSVSPQPSAVG
jgi:membrane fusion protein (multidrug efflux system)